MRSCVRVLQMPDVFASPLLLSLPLPLVPAWAQGLNQSIRAPGTRAQQSLCAAQRSAALSGSMHLWPGGELGEEGKPWCPCMPVSLEVGSVSAAWPFNSEGETWAYYQIRQISYSMPVIDKAVMLCLKNVLSNRLLWCSRNAGSHMFTYTCVFPKKTECYNFVLLCHWE